MAQIKYSLLLILVFFFFSCKTQKTSSRTVVSPIWQRESLNIVYDTISGVFFYENSIASYIEGDAYVKSNGFIHADSVTQFAYSQGYYLEGGPYVDHLKNKGIIVRLDKSSIAEFYDSLFQKSIRTDTYRSKTDINPFCGGYYKKYEMKVEVLYIDTVSQRVPLFMDCSGYEKFAQDNRGKNYVITPLPTYAITKIFSWREL